jgi:hypothetical protein
VTPEMPFPSIRLCRTTLSYAADPGNGAAITTPAPKPVSPLLRIVLLLIVLS